MKNLENELYELSCITRKIKTLEAEIKELKGYEEEYKKVILDTMEKYDMQSFENAELKIRYVKPVVVARVDSALLGEKYPDVYLEVAKETTSKASLRITLKKGI